MRRHRDDHPHPGPDRATGTAPSTTKAMLSYLRPHRRTTSSPSSPNPDPLSSFEGPVHLHPDAPPPPRQHDVPGLSSRLRPSQSLAQPPLLPPIARVSASHGDLAHEYIRQRPVESTTFQDLSPPLRPPNSRNGYHMETLEEWGEGEDRSPMASAVPKNELRVKHSAPTLPTAVSPDPQSSFEKTSIGTRLPTPPPAPKTAMSTFEPSGHRASKRLNLLNPMTLLARRRTQQGHPTNLAVAGMGDTSPAESYDPRIRGTKVHDFSAPRPRQTVDTNLIFSQHNALGVRVESPAESGHSAAHTPVFKEDFDEEQYPAAGPHVRKASDLTDLNMPRLPYAGEPPAVVDRRQPETGVLQKRLSQDVVPPWDRRDAPAIPEVVPEHPLSENEPPQEAAKPPRASSSRRTRRRNLSDVSIKDGSGLPKHMKSTSSRFSFDMIGAAKQEKLLEERHRQRALEKRADESEFDEGDAFDDFDYDPEADDYGLEERIPGVNAEDDDDYDLEEPIPGVNADDSSEDEFLPLSKPANLNFNFYQHPQSSITGPLSPDSAQTVTTPRDVNGDVIGFAVTKESPFHPDVAVFPDQMGAPAAAQPAKQSVAAEPAPEDHEERQLSRIQTNFDDDELYFDDGIIEGPGNVESAPFDESIFDQDDTDQYGRPLRPHTFGNSQSLLYTPPTIDAGPAQEHTETQKSGRASPTAGPVSAEKSHASQSLTFDSLAAYQSALAAAAHSAAANGKFRRSSASTAEDDHDDGPPLIPDSGHQSSEYSRLEPFSPTYPVEDDFDFGDGDENDPIIAEANAEALANDWDGFYGSEFGFYSAPSPGGDVTFTNGGYLDYHRMDRMVRSHSGRHVHREPNLTPITERSEYSNRNSIMSLQQRGADGLVNSPGLSQLAGMLTDDPDGSIGSDLSLSALLKLRRGAWGGSQASLHSSNGSPLDDAGSSPLGRVPSWGFAGHVRKNSSLSIPSDHDHSPRPDSPMLTMATRAVRAPPPQTQLQTQAVSPMSPVAEAAPPEDALAALRDGDTTAAHNERDDRGHGHNNDYNHDHDHEAAAAPPPPAAATRPPKPAHRRTSSGDSVSYSREPDPGGGQRWVLERRRTGDDGGVEVLNREVVASGMI